MAADSGASSPASPGSPAASFKRRQLRHGGCGSGGGGVEEGGGSLAGKDLASPRYACGRRARPTSGELAATSARSRVRARGVPVFCVCAPAPCAFGRLPVCHPLSRPSQARARVRARVALDGLGFRVRVSARVALDVFLRVCVYMRKLLRSGACRSVLPSPILKTVLSFATHSLENAGCACCGGITGANRRCDLAWVGSASVMFAWACTGLHRYAWVCMGLHGPAWTCIGLSWACMGLHGPA
eukprot:354972-Chlamydomonas_euryale.AAC.3